jgi:hypothetical protein
MPSEISAVFIMRQVRYGAQDSIQLKRRLMFYSQQLDGSVLIYLRIPGKPAIVLLAPLSKRRLRFRQHRERILAGDFRYGE